MKKALIYIAYLIVISFAILEVGIRFFTKKNPAGVDLFLDQKHRYLLPLPADSANFYEGATTETQNDGYRVFDDTLGWSHKPWGHDTTDFLCYANNLGFRIDSASYKNREEALKHYNIITIGNSFTHGDAVICEESWPYVLGKNSGKTVANLGVGGYGLQQALLRLMHSGITADTVIFGAIWGDFERALEPVYTFYQGGNKTRPVFNFTQNGYDLINVPVLTPREFYDTKKAHNHEIYKHIVGFNEDVFSDAWWTNSHVLRLVYSMKQQKSANREKPIYLSDDEDLAHCINIFRLFKTYCDQNDMYAKVVLLDTGQNFWHKDQYGLNNPWDLVKEKLTELGIPHVEFHSELFHAHQENRANVIHPVENLHYSAVGNSLVADLLLRHLENN